MALKINLKAGDRLLMGSARVLVAGEGYTTLIIEGDLPVLRESEALDATEAVTISQRFRYALQQAYLTREPGHIEDAAELASQMDRDMGAAEECLTQFRAGKQFQALRKAAEMSGRSAKS